jgi:hypothetical protein
MAVPTRAIPVCDTSDVLCGLDDSRSADGIGEVFGAKPQTHRLVDPAPRSVPRDPSERLLSRVFARRRGKLGDGDEN